MTDDGYLDVVLVYRDGSEVAVTARVIGILHDDTRQYVGKAPAGRGCPETVRFPVLPPRTSVRIEVESCIEVAT